MKILKIKDNKFVKWVLIIMICYILASIGVNGVINPYYYVNSGEKESLQWNNKDEFLVVDLQAVRSEEGFLNIRVSNMNTFQAKINVALNKQSENPLKEKWNLCEGINSHQLMVSNEDIKDIAISKKELTDAEIEITDIFWTTQKQVNTRKMVEVTISFVAIVIFYLFMAWLKNKYSK